MNDRDIIHAPYVPIYGASLIEEGIAARSLPLNLNWTPEGRDLQEFQNRMYSIESLLRLPEGTMNNGRRAVRQELQNSLVSRLEQFEGRMATPDVVENMQREVSSVMAEFVNNHYWDFNESAAELTNRIMHDITPAGTYRNMGTFRGAPVFTESNLNPDDVEEGDGARADDYGDSADAVAGAINSITRMSPGETPANLNFGDPVEELTRNISDQRIRDQSQQMMRNQRQHIDDNVRNPEDHPDDSIRRALTSPPNPETEGLRPQNLDESLHTSRMTRESLDRIVPANPEEDDPFGLNRRLEREGALNATEVTSAYVPTDDEMNQLGLSPRGYGNISSGTSATSIQMNNSRMLHSEQAIREKVHQLGCRKIVIEPFSREGVGVAVYGMTVYVDKINSVTEWLDDEKGKECFPMGAQIFFKHISEWQK